MIVERDCLMCRRLVLLTYSFTRRYFRGRCDCGALCTSDRPWTPPMSAPCNRSLRALLSRVRAASGRDLPHSRLPRQP